MTDIPRKYIVDDHEKKVAVQLDIETFEEDRRASGKLRLGAVDEARRRRGEADCSRNEVWQLLTQ